MGGKGETLPSSNKLKGYVFHEFVPAIANLGRQFSRKQPAKNSSKFNRTKLREKSSRSSWQHLLEPQWFGRDAALSG